MVMVTTYPRMDEGFLRRVAAASLALSLFGGLLGAYYLHWRWGAGFVVAGVWSTLNLRALEFLIRQSLRPSGRQNSAIAVALLIKLPVLYGIGGLIVIKGRFPIGALLLGLAVPTVVMALKAVGQVLAPRMALDRSRERGQGDAE
jgi:hypothetical protein